VIVNDSAEELFRRRCFSLPPKLPPTAQRQQSRQSFDVMCGSASSGDTNDNDAVLGSLFKYGAIRRLPVTT